VFLPSFLSFYLPPYLLIYFSLLSYFVCLPPLLSLFISSICYFFLLRNLNSCSVDSISIGLVGSNAMVTCTSILEEHTASTLKASPHGITTQKINNDKKVPPAFMKTKGSLPCSQMSLDYVVCHFSLVHAVHKFRAYLLWAFMLAICKVHQNNDFLQLSLSTMILWQQ
jgi:hypothetical protein